MKIEASLLERFVEKVLFTDECWIWQGARHPRGHGQLWRNPRVHYAHRISYELFVGPIPEGLEIDHLCQNPPCVRPEHLEPVKHGENVRRALQKTHCLRGHLYNEANTWYHNGGKRYCRACQQKRDKGRRRDSRERKRRATNTKHREEVVTG